MDNPALPPDLDYRRRSGLFEGRQGAETRRNLFVRFMPCNPLISPDSDEEIQGNPTLIIGGFRNETAGSQENPNRIVSTTSRPAAEKKTHRPIQHKAP